MRTAIPLEVLSSAEWLRMFLCHADDLMIWRILMPCGIRSQPKWPQWDFLSCLCRRYWAILLWIRHKFTWISQIALHHPNFSILPAYEETMLFPRHYAVQWWAIPCMAHPRLHLCCIICSPQADTDWHRIRRAWPSSPGRGREEDIPEYRFVDLIWNV